MNMQNSFNEISRDEIRNIFQPSKVVLGIVAAPLPSGYNILPLCFHTWCSYDPLLYAVAVENSNYSCELFQKADRFALAIIGESMVQEVVFCGTHSGRDCDKARACGIKWTEGFKIRVPGIETAIANIELIIKKRVPTGDHTLIIGEVVFISLAKNTKERPLLAIGPNSIGYEVLAREGIHTLGVVQK